MKKFYLATKLACLVTGLLIFSATHAQFREKYNSGNVNRDIKGMSFLTPSTGFVAFTNYIGFTQDSGQTYTARYINAGNTDFNGYSVNLILGFIAKGVHAFTADSLLAYGNFGAAPAIVFSGNQGLTWKLVNLRPVSGADIYNNIFDIKFPGNGNTGIAVNHSEILRSTNRGQNWTVVVSGLFNKERLSFPTSLVGYCVGNNVLMKTTNGGTSWNQTSMPAGTNSSSDYNNVFFTNANVGYITENLKYQFWKTANGGSTWTKMNNETIIPISGNDLQFVNDSTAFISKPFSYDVYKTTDSGKVWEPCKKNSSYAYLGYGFERLHFNNDIGWAGGAGEYLMIASPGIPVWPKSFFKIDTVNYYQAGVVKLQSWSKSTYQHSWYKNDTLISTGYNAQYTRGYYPLLDTIKLVVSNGIDADSSIQYQSFNAPGSVPFISSFIPAAGTSLADIVIYGSNFTGVTSVTFGGVAARFFNVVNNTQINANVGLTGATGDVVVTKPSTPAASKAGFTFLPKPVISSVSPNAGNVGSTVTINGSQFSAVPTDNIVYFGAVKAIVLTATATQLTVIVPPGSTSHGVVTVTVNTLTAFSPQNFDVTYTGGSIVQLSQPSRFDIATGNQPKDVTVADLDNDGKPDLAVPNKTSDAMYVYRNNSLADSIRFQDPLILSGTRVANPMGVAAVDVNGDGRQDLIVTSAIGSNNHHLGGNNITLYENTSTPGNISFAAPRDFSTTTNFNYHNPETIVVEDIDGNGKQDVAVANVHDGTVSMFLNRSGGGNISLQRYDPSVGGIQSEPYSLAMRDLDGDGLPDLVSGVKWSAFTSKTWAFRNRSILANNSLGFDPPYDVSPGPVRPRHTSLADMDGDGKMDIISTDSTGNKIFVYRNLSVLGTITISPPIELLAGANVFNAEIGDINGDGKPDIIATNRGSNTVSVFINTSSVGNLSFTAPSSHAVGNGPEGLALADLNGDQRPEIIVADNLLNKLTILHWSGSSTVLVCQPGSTATIPANISGSSFQWQADTGSGFINISDNANYTGTNSNSLLITGFNQTWNGYKYRCIADGFTGPEYKIKLGIVWTGGVSNAWENPANWSCNVLPDASSDVIFNSGYAIVNSNVSIRSLTANPTVIIKVNDGFQLNILY